MHTTLHDTYIPISYAEQVNLHLIYSPAYQISGHIRIHWLILDTKLNEANQTRDNDDLLERSKKELDIIDDILDRLKELSRETSTIIRDVTIMKEQIEHDHRSYAAIHDSQLELMVNTENGMVNLPIEFSKDNKAGYKYDFIKQFNAAKKESLGSRRAGPTFLHNVTLQKTRCGMMPMGAISQNDNLWILSSDGYNGHLCHLEGDLKNACTHYEVCESKINAMQHVSVGMHKRLQEQFLCSATAHDERFERW